MEKIRPVLHANKNAPDIFLGEAVVVKEIVESGYWDDLSKDPYKADVKDLVPYQVKMGTDSKGDWGLTYGPNSYFWGGTWLGIYTKSKQKQLAWKFIQMMTLDKETLKLWARSTGDFIGNQAVLNEIKDDFADPCLNGQNHYKFFASEAPKVNADIICKYEQKIRGFFMDAIYDYVE